MVLPDFDTLKTDVLQAEHRLYEVERIYGKHSDEYKSALSRFARIWLVMRMRRKPDEFMPDCLTAVN